MIFRVSLAGLLAALLLHVPVCSGAVVVVEADFSKSVGIVRPLHGINKGPLPGGGLLDLTEPLKALHLPSIRLHDCRWPNPDVVDIHAVFPDFEADPEKSSSYHFGQTDEYLAATHATGASIVYRLGESIEHTKIKRWVHPPKDPAKWAAICLGIIRHYNEGWADGFHYGIRYWEIWNEPENRPAMWSGTDADYFRLYEAASRAIKARYPSLKIGGPAVGASGQFAKGEFQPTAFVRDFLSLCKTKSLPLDFFSWHCYTDDPSELPKRAKAIRRLLDQNGFQKIESHLNEWNYLPGNSWAGPSTSSTPLARQRFYEEMAGPAGAAFIVASLLELQSAPVDVCNLFHGEIGGFGLFSENGVPQKNYEALRAFDAFSRFPQRVEVIGPTATNLTICAAMNPQTGAIAFLVANRSHEKRELFFQPRNLPWSGSGEVERRLVDADHGFETAPLTKTYVGASDLRVEVTGPGVVLIRVSK